MLSRYSNSIQANCDETIVNLEKGLKLVEDTGVLVEHNAVSTMAIDEFRGGNGHGGTEEPSRQEAEGKWKWTIWEPIMSKIKIIWKLLGLSYQTYQRRSVQKSAE